MIMGFRKAIDKARAAQAKASQLMADQKALSATLRAEKAAQNTPYTPQHPLRLDVSSTSRTGSTGLVFTGHVYTQITYLWAVSDANGYVVAHGRSPREKKAYREGNAALVQHRAL